MQEQDLERVDWPVVGSDQAQKQLSLGTWNSEAMDRYGAALDLEREPRALVLELRPGAVCQFCSLPGPAHIRT